MTGGTSFSIGPHGTIGPYKRGSYGDSGNNVATGSAFTIAGWAYYPTAELKVHAGLFGNLTTSGWSLASNWSATRGLLAYVGSTGYCYNLGTILPVDRPFHWALRVDVNQSTNAEKVQIWIDGASQTLTFAGSAPAVNTIQKFTVGQGTSIASSNTWPGWIWAVAAWNRRLAPAEIAYLVRPQSRYDLFQPHRMEGFLPTTADSALLSVDDLLHAHSIDAPIPTFAGNLVVDALDHAHEIEAPTLSAASNLVVDALDHTHTLDAPVATFAGTLTIDELTHAHTIDEVTLASASAVFDASAVLTETTLSGKKLRITLTGATWIN